MRHRYPKQTVIMYTELVAVYWGGKLVVTDRWRIIVSQKVSHGPVPLNVDEHKPSHNGGTGNVMQRGGSIFGACSIKSMKVNNLNGPGSWIDDKSLANAGVKLRTFAVMTLQFREADQM